MAYDLFQQIYSIIASSTPLGHSMWGSWQTYGNLGRAFSGILPLSPATNFIPLLSPFSLHLNFVLFISSAPVLMRIARTFRG